MRTYGSDSHVTALLKFLATGLTSFAKLVSERTFFFVLVWSTVEHLQPHFTWPYVERIMNRRSETNCRLRRAQALTSTKMHRVTTGPNTEATKLSCTPHIDAVSSQTVPLYLCSIERGHSNGGVVSGFPSTVHLACRRRHMNGRDHCGMN